MDDLNERIKRFINERDAKAGLLTEVEFKRLKEIFNKSLRKKLSEEEENEMKELYLKLKK